MNKVYFWSRLRVAVRSLSVVFAVFTLVVILAFGSAPKALADVSHVSDVQSASDVSEGTDASGVSDTEFASDSVPLTSEPSNEAASDATNESTGDATSDATSDPTNSESEIAPEGSDATDSESEEGAEASDLPIAVHDVYEYSEGVIATDATLAVALADDAETPTIDLIDSVNWTYGDEPIIQIECPASVSDGGTLSYEWYGDVAVNDSDEFDGNIDWDSSSNFFSGYHTRTLTVNARTFIEEFGGSSTYFSCEATNTNTAVSGTQTAKAVSDTFSLSLNQKQLPTNVNDVHIVVGGQVPDVSTLTYRISGLVYGHNIEDALSGGVLVYFTKDSCTINVNNINAVYQYCVGFDEYPEVINKGYGFPSPVDGWIYVESAEDAAFWNHQDPGTGITVNCVNVEESYCQELPAGVILVVIPKTNVTAHEYTQFINEINAGDKPEGKQYALHKLFDVKLLNEDGSIFQPNIGDVPTDVVVHIPLDASDFAIVGNEPPLYHRHGDESVQQHDVVDYNFGITFKTNRFSLFGIPYLVDAEDNGDDNIVEPINPENPEDLADVSADQAEILAQTGVPVGMFLLVILGLLISGYFARNFTRHSKRQGQS